MANKKYLDYEGVTRLAQFITNTFIGSKEDWNALTPEQQSRYKLVNINDENSASAITSGVAFKGTRAEYETAKLIPAGADGHISNGALVIITDEDDYIYGKEVNNV